MPPVYRELYDIIIVNKSYAEQPDRRKGQIISPGGLFMDYNDQKLKNFDLKYNFLLPTLSLVLYYMLMLMVVEAIPGLNLSLLAYSIIFLMGLEGIITIYLYRLIYLPVFFPLLEDRKSTRLNSSHVRISYAVFC